jgi:hypothetical protein
LENYLIDIDVLTELLNRDDVVRNPVGSEGRVANLIRNLALAQLDEVVARQVYSGFAYDSPGLRSDDVMGKTLAEMANALFQRVERARRSIVNHVREDWMDDFIRLCEQERRQLEPVWESTWKEACNGKKLFEDLQRQGILRMSPTVFKRRIIQRMRDGVSENWRLVESQLVELIENKV